MKSITEMSSSELFTEMTDKQRDDIYRMVWFGHVEDDTEMCLRAEYDEDIWSDESQKDGITEYVANAFVYDGRYDCNLSYWDNINNLIEECLFY